MTSRLTRQKRAQLFPLILIIAVIAAIGGGAFMLSRSLGSEITGFETYSEGCNGTIDNPGQYSIGSGLTCPSTDNGINISSDDVVLDCGGKTIHSEGGNNYGIMINGTNNVEIMNCIISGFSTGIEYANTGDITSGKLSGNVLASTGPDVDFGSASNINVSRNNFRGESGLTGDRANQVFCDSPTGRVGNFYNHKIPADSRGQGDCGNITPVTNITGGTNFSSDNYFITINWSDQSSSPYEDITYIVDYNLYDIDSDQWLGWEWLDSVQDPYMYLEWSADSEADVLPYLKMNLRVVPNAGSVDATGEETGEFILDMDVDNDGYGYLADYATYDAWDCNDSNSNTHQPAYRENDTSPNTTFCYDTFDDDCDGYTDWLDDGCGHGFTTGVFNDSLYTNGSINDITTSHVNGGAPDDYYVLVENQYGRIEYDTEMDLTGVDFDNVFDFGYNELTVDPTAENGLFDQPATVMIKDLTTYKKVPVVLKDGSPCSPEVCTNMVPDPNNPAQGDFSAFGNDIKFDVASFSTFTTTSNSRLATFTQNDSESAGVSPTFPAALETYHRIRFFANYTRFSDGEPINNLTPNPPSSYADNYHNGSCNITLIMPDGSPIAGSENQRMEYDPYYDIYWFESGVFNFTGASSYYHYNISCRSDLYEPVNISETFRVADDETPPQPPVLYPQILLYPSNLTANKSTWVAGYFGESDINLTATVLHSHWPSLELVSDTNYSGIYSEYKGELILVKADANRGQNVVLVEWNTTNQRIEEALGYFKYVEFSSHNRTYFDRYNITNFTRGGNYIWIQLGEDLDEDVKINDFMRLYSAPHPPGYFKVNVSLYTGSNLISVWGTDKAGNAGYASEDTINAPYPDTAPPAPVLWGPPEAVKNNSAFDLIGYINESAERLNLTVVLTRGDFLNYVWNDTFWETTLHTTANVYSDRDAGKDFFYIDQGRFNEINLTLNWDDLWVEFSNHDRDYWFRYNVTQGIDYPVEEGSRVYIDPPLEHSVDNTVIASFYNNTYHQGWFNTSINMTALTLVDSTTGGLYKLQAVGFRNETEGYPSAAYYIYNDPEAPEFNLTGVTTHSNERNPTFTFNVSDDFKVDIPTLLINVSNSTAGYYRAYAYDSSQFPGYNITSNISCTDFYGDQSLYNCSIMLDDVASMNYTVNFTVQDKAGWLTSVSQQMEIVITIIDISYVYDDDDITNDLWLNFTWGPTPPNLQNYEFALGTAAYPDDDYDSVKAWQSSCDALGSCAQNWVNFSHDSNISDINATELKMMTGTVYYLTVRAKNNIGQYGTPKSSNGILFIDNTPPVFRSINDHGPWTDSNSQLSATWTFEDNESDIIEYAYAIGTAQYPNTGWNSIKGPIYGLGAASSTDGSLNLIENKTYYYSVKARNGNTAMNYTGSWSGWHSSGGVTVDTLPPFGGSINWTNSTYITSGFVTVQFNVGQDWPGTSDNVKGMIEVGSSVLSGGGCEHIDDFDWQNSSDILQTGQSYKDVNVSSGRCYVFRLFTWDNASNSRTYQMPNETVRVVKVDQTPPTDVAPVIDDGFYTNDRTSLHALWTESHDDQSGFSHYSWRVLEQPVVSPTCVIDIANPENTDCDQIIAGNGTANEISINNLNLTHNYKYYFEVRAWNNAGRNSTPRYSDGIIFLDNAPPATVKIEQVNEVNETSSPYYSRLRTNHANITAIGDFDGYNDIARCVLLPNNVDYREDNYGKNCTISPHQYFSGEYPDVTVVNCTMNTSADMGSAIQGNFSWYVSCRDHYWNAQSFTQNALVEFTIDWPDAPWIVVEVTNNTDGTTAYSDTSLWCDADITDPDQEKNLNCSNIEFRWYSGSKLISASNVSSYDSGTGWCKALDVLSSSETARSQDLTCQVSAYDTYYPTYNTKNVSNDSMFIRNTQPYDLTLDLPADEAVTTSNITFGWMGPYDDIDNDFITLEIQVDDESGEFNYSNNPELEFNDPQEMLVGGISIPGTQRNPDIYRNRIVYEDNRSSDWDIYMYDMDTDTETPIATSPGDQINPQIYGDYILYEHDNSDGTSRLYKYTISTAVTEELQSAINTSSMDYFGNYVVYNNGTGVVFQDVLLGGSPQSVSGSDSSARFVSVYGKDIVWGVSGIGWRLYDMVNDSTIYRATMINGIGMFGSKVVIEGPLIGILDVHNLSHVQFISGSNMSLYGGLLVYRNASTGITITDILTGNLYNVSLGMTGTNPAIYDDTVVFENSDNLYYASRKVVLPATFIIENPVDANYYTVDTTYSNDGDYDWRIVGCDNAFSENDSSCVKSDSLTVTVDNTAPVISSISPTQSSIVGGIFKVWAKITDTPGDYTDVAAANYTLKYRDNATVFSSGDMSRSGNVWNSSNIDFTSISLANFSLFISAVDEMGNWAHANVNFTVNNETPWFIFGTGADEITVDGLTAFNSTIRSDFIAYNVLTSKLTIVGPLPATTVRFVQSKINTTVTNHNYSDDISTATWPEGNYVVHFNGSTLGNLKKYDNRSFWIDKRPPRYYAASPSSMYANETVVLEINWTDTTLVSVNMTYNNTNISNLTKITEYFNATSSSQLFSSDELDLCQYINKTFYWMSSAIDKRLTANDTGGWLATSILDNPPYFKGTIADPSLDEDTSVEWSLSLSDYFKDANTVGACADLDNLTFSYTTNVSAINLTLDPNTGQVTNMTANLSDFNGDVNLTFTATDYYGNSTRSNPITVTVISVNDAPYFTGTIPAMYSYEDNATGLVFNLSSYADDVEHDVINWSVVGYNDSIVNLTYSSTIGDFNFTLLPDANGVFNITFAITDGIISSPVTTDVLVTVINVGDAPTRPAITNSTTGGSTPNISSTASSSIPITWNASTDADGETVTYTIEYSTDNGTSWNIIETGWPTESYSWDSASNITNDEQNITLRVTAASGAQTNESSWYGNFTVDNRGPVITIDKPANIVVGTSAFVNVTTSEPTDCNILLNGTSINQTTAETEHHAMATGLTYNTTYEINATCTDYMGNVNSTSKLFAARETGLMFVSATANRTVLKESESVNITFEIWTRSALTDFNWTITNGTATWEYNITNIAPVIDESNSIALVTAPLDTTEAGTYTLTVTNISSVMDGDKTATEGGAKGTIYTVFPVFTQTINVE